VRLGSGATYEKVPGPLPQTNLPYSITPLPAQRWHSKPAGVSWCHPSSTTAPQWVQIPRMVGDPCPQTGSPLEPQPNFCRARCHHPRRRVNSMSCIIAKFLLFSITLAKPRRVMGLKSAGLPGPFSLPACREGWHDAAGMNFFEISHQNMVLKLSTWKTLKKSEKIAYLRR
jgi:hypothetical protein